MILKFKFKENRKYVHGPDIFYAVLDLIIGKLESTPTSIKLTSKNLSQNQLFASENLLKNRKIQSIVDYVLEERVYKMYVYEHEEPVTNFIDYDEQDIVDHTEFFDNMGIIRQYTRYSLAEIAVAILKEICKKNISNKVKWVFVGLELKTWIEKHTSKTIEIKLVKNLGTKMVVSDIYLESEIIGQLKFSSI